MEADSKAIAVGLGAGLGGFAGLVIVVCILWHIFCGTWCEKNKGKSTIIPLTNKDHRTMEKESSNKLRSHATNVTPANIKTVQICSSNNEPPR